MKFSDRIKAARKGSGLSVEDAAKRIGVSRSTIEKWEAGDRTPKPVMAAHAVKTLEGKP